MFHLFIDLPHFCSTFRNNFIVHLSVQWTNHFHGVSFRLRYFLIYIFLIFGSLPGQGYVKTDFCQSYGDVIEHYWHQWYWLIMNSILCQMLTKGMFMMWNTCVTCNLKRIQANLLNVYPDIKLIDITVLKGLSRH